MKDFDAEYFFELCRRYGVKFSNEYTEPVIKHEDGSITKFSELTEDKLHRIFFGERVLC